MNTNESEFDDALDLARSLLGCNEDSGDLWDANELVNHAISLRPSAPDAWILKCQTLSALEDNTAALAAVEMAVQLAPRRAEAHYWRAASLCDLQRYDEALTAIERGFHHLNEHEHWLIEDLYHEKAQVLDATGRREDAVATYEAGLLRCPHSNLLHTGLEPLRRETKRSRFTVLEGGRR